MMQNDSVSTYTFREFRPHTVMFSQIPIFSNSNTTKTPSYRHHTSLYGITEEEARIQKRLGNTKNRTVRHYSSELVIDTDNIETAEKVWDELYKKDFSFEMWKLNNYKFFLQRDESDKPSNEMCYQDKQFIKDNFFHCNVYTNNSGLDLGIYSSPFHLIRAKNSIHEVTKAKSILIENHKGSNLVATNDVQVKILEKPCNLTLDVNASDWSQLQRIIDFAMGKSVNNHTAIWQFAKDISKFVTFSTGLELVQLYAKSLNYCEIKAERAMRQGFAAAVL